MKHFVRFLKVKAGGQTGELIRLCAGTEYAKEVRFRYKIRNADDSTTWYEHVVSIPRNLLEHPVPMTNQSIRTIFSYAIYI